MYPERVVETFHFLFQFKMINRFLYYFDYQEFALGVFLFLIQNANSLDQKTLRRVYRERDDKREIVTFYLTPQQLVEVQLLNLEANENN